MLSVVGLTFALERTV